jgi:hemolysin III
MKIKIKDPVSALTHFAGFITAIPILILLVYKSSVSATPWHIFSFIIFGLALMALYGASTIYHWACISKEKEKILRRIDHMMIFVLIAGTYTPVCLVPLRGAWGWTLLCLVWGLAIGGIVLKALWLEAPRWLSTAIYVLMGWIVVIAFYPLTQAVPSAGIKLLVAGGVTYTIGALIYAIKWVPFQNKWFGAHEVFHLFVMGGSLFHIVFMFKYILNITVI